MPCSDWRHRPCCNCRTAPSRWRATARRSMLHWPRCRNGITMSLPFFNRNRGNIAIERATRQKLHDEYQQRLQTSRNDIAGIAAEQALDARQLAQVDAAIVELRTVLARSDTAYRADAVDALTYANARAALLAKQVERINLWQAMLEQRVALQTLLGVDTTAPLSESEVAR